MGYSNDILTSATTLGIDINDLSNMRVRDIANKFRELKDKLIQKNNTNPYKDAEDDEAFLDDLEELSSAYEELKNYLKERDKSNKKDEISDLLTFPVDHARNLKFRHIVRDFPIPKAYEGKGLKYKLVDGVLDLDLLLPPTLKNNDRLMFFQKTGDILLELNIRFIEKAQ